MSATTTMVIMWISWTVWQHYGFSSVGAMLGGTIVALHGEVVGDEEKYGCLKREIIGEAL